MKLLLCLFLAALAPVPCCLSSVSAGEPSGFRPVRLGGALPPPPFLSPPGFTSPETADAALNTPFSYRLTTVDSEATLSLVGDAPPGLSFDPGSGLLAGIPIQAGDYTVNFLAANRDGSSTFALALRVSATPSPTVTVTAAAPEIVYGSGETGRFVFTLSAPAPTDLVLAYRVKGSAANGSDYGLLKGFTKIKAGETRRTIKLKPLGAGPTVGKRSVKLRVVPGTGYQLAAPEKAVIRLVAPGR